MVQAMEMGFKKASQKIQELDYEKILHYSRENIEAFAQADMNTESVNAVEKNISRRKKKVTLERKLEARKKQAQAAEARATQMLREGRL